MKEDVAEAQGDSNRANFKIKTLEKKLNSAKAQMDEKLEEIDKLYEETDLLKNTLEQIRQKYDFSAIDRNKASLERYETWSLKIMQVTNKLSATFESHFNCGLCSNMAEEITIVEPCNHVFCKQCYENQGKHSTCRVCGDTEEKVYQSLMASEWIEAYEGELLALDKVQKLFNDVQGDPMERLTI